MVDCNLRQSTVILFLVPNLLKLFCILLLTIFLTRHTSAPTFTLTSE